MWQCAIYILTHTYTTVYQVNNSDSRENVFEFVCCNTVLRSMMHFSLHWFIILLFTWLNIPHLLFPYLSNRIEFTVKKNINFILRAFTETLICPMTYARLEYVHKGYVLWRKHTEYWQKSNNQITFLDGRSRKLRPKS